MRRRIKNILMAVICFLSYGTWRFETAYDTIYRALEKSRRILVAARKR